MKKIISLFLTMLMVFLPAAFVFATGEDSNTDAIDAGLYYVMYDGYSSYLVDGYGNRVEESGNNSRSKSGTSELPSSYDSRDYDLVNPVRNQSSTSICYAFSTTSCLESYVIKKGWETRETALFSPSYLVSFVYSTEDETNSNLDGEGHGYAGNIFKYGGEYNRVVNTLSEWTGIAREEDYPFDANDQSSMVCDASEKYNNTSGYVVGSTSMLTTDEQIKSWILENGSCAAAMYFQQYYTDSDNTRKWIENRSTGAYNLTEQYGTDNGITGTNHQVTVIGWDDDFDASNFNEDFTPASNGAWLIKNSWGDYNDIGGYTWVSYEDGYITNFYGFTAQKKDTYKTNYTYNGAAALAYLPVSTTYKTANKFTTTGYEELDAVSFYTMEEGDTVTVDIYTGLSSSDDPDAGTLAVSQTYSFDNIGYHIAELDSPVTMSPDTIFSIVLSFSNSENSYKIPVEHCGTVYDNGNTSSAYAQYTVDASQSYIYFGKWGDMKTQKFNTTDGTTTMGNFYIQAFTNCDHNILTSHMAPTCTEDGSTYTYCSRCDYMSETTILPATGHNLGPVTTTYDSTERKTTTGRYCLNEGCYYCEIIREYYDSNSGTLTFKEFVRAVIQMLRKEFSGKLTEFIQKRLDVYFGD